MFAFFADPVAYSSYHYINSDGISGTKWRNYLSFLHFMLVRGNLRSSIRCFLLGNMYVPMFGFPLFVLKRHKHFTSGLKKWYLAAQLVQFLTNAEGRY